MRDVLRVGLFSGLLMGIVASAAPCQRPAPDPGLAIGQTDFARLQWIEGSWRGRASGGAPFFERYHFDNDSTLVVESFADSKFSKRTDQVRYLWRDRHFGKRGPGPQWVATSFDSVSVGFKPAAGGGNALIWRRVDEDHWSAVMTWPPTLDKPAREVVYKMERVNGN